MTYTVYKSTMNKEFVVDHKNKPDIGSVREYRNSMLKSFNNLKDAENFCKENRSKLKIVNSRKDLRTQSLDFLYIVKHEKNKNPKYDSGQTISSYTHPLNENLLRLPI